MLKCRWIKYESNYFFSLRPSKFRRALRAGYLPLRISSPAVSLVVSVVVAVVPLICSPRSLWFHLLVKAPILIDLSHLLLRIWYPIRCAPWRPLFFLRTGGDDLKTTWWHDLNKHMTNPLITTWLRMQIKNSHNTEKQTLQTIQSRR